MKKKMVFLSKLFGLFYVKKEIKFIGSYSSGKFYSLLIGIFEICSRGLRGLIMASSEVVELQIILFHIYIFLAYALVLKFLSCGF